ncbi:hypothetical protein CG51_17095 [Haematobacter missouriensis]|nr:hypothetical protein CG51_17095 [Haematobacter missouriensis]
MPIRPFSADLSVFPCIAVLRAGLKEPCACPAGFDNLPPSGLDAGDPGCETSRFKSVQERGMEKLPEDIAGLFARLDRSRFRSRFRLGQGEQAYVAAKGRETVARHAADFVGRRLAPAAPVNDGRQTPMRGHPVFIAQHATATCCRGCLAKWHGIPVGRPLDEAEQEMILRILMIWIDRQSSGKHPGRALP